MQTAPELAPAELLPADVEGEAERLLVRLLNVDCEPGRKWDLAACRRIAPLTLRINRLKAETGALVLAHSYVEPEIIYGVADFTGDSYDLSRRARDAAAPRIVFAGVVFMAETVKILSPQSEVLVPDPESGCSLADSLTAERLRELKSANPGAAVVCYVNSSAEVKAESDVCVTSSNVYDIAERLPQRRILFVPDRLMGENLRAELRRRGSDKEVVSSDGTCIVHDAFRPEDVERARAQFPGIAVVAHPECPPEVARLADFVGSTRAMMEYVARSGAPYHLVLTECGLVGRLQAESPTKRLVAGCRLCPFMKRNSLEKILQVLSSPRPGQVIRLDEGLRRRAAVSLDRMFELANPR
jgi:quinolinate synthase